jgi:outer membrane protein insertion porin family
MKGFPLFLLGPQISDPNNGGAQLPLGGSLEAFALFELEYPLIREAGLKWVVFVDAGNDWTQPWDNNIVSPTSDTFPFLRTDAGFGIRWFSPIGPLRFEWGFPIGRKVYENAVTFNFFIGPPF